MGAMRSPLKTWKKGSPAAEALPLAQESLADAASAVPLWEIAQSTPTYVAPAAKDKEGTALQWLSALGFGVAALLLSFLFHRFFFRGYDMESLDLAQLARNLSHGQGFSTDFLRPHSLAGAPTKLIPDLTNAPLYPLLLGLAFAFLGEGDAALAVLPALLFALSAGLFFVLARRLSESFLVSCLAVAAFISAQPTLAVVDSARPPILSTFLLLLLLLVITPFRRPSLSQTEGSIENRKGLRHHVLIGALVGFCALADYFSLLYVIPLLLLWKPLTETPGAEAKPPSDATAATIEDAPKQKKRAGRPFLGLMLGLALVISPWLWRNTLLTGNPFFTTQWLEIVMNTPRNPGLSLLRDANPARELWPGLGALFIKWARGVVALFSALPALSHLFWAPFAIAALFLRLESVRLNRFKKAALAALALYGLGLALLGRSPASLLPMAPLIALLGAAAYVQLAALWSKHLSEREGEGSLASPLTTGARRGQALRGLVPLLSVILPFLLFTGSLAKQALANRDVEPYKADIVAWFEPIRAAVKAGDKNNDKRAIASDMPWAVAWYAQKRAVWLPNTRAQLPAVEAKQPLSAIYLSPALSDPRGDFATDALWLKTYRGAAEIKGFFRNQRPAQRDVLFSKFPTLNEVKGLAKSQPKNLGYQMVLGETQLVERRYQDALVTFARVQKALPKAPHPLLGAGKAYLGLKMPAKALVAFEGAIGRADSAPAVRAEAQLRAADLLTGRGQTRRAMPLYEAVLADQPGNTVALNNLAFLYANDGGNLNRALEMSRRAAASAPQSGLARDTLGWVCFRMKRFPEAVLHLREAARLSPRDAGVKNHLKQALKAAGQSANNV